MNNYVPGFSNYLQRFAEGGQALPTEQPVAAEPVAPARRSTATLARDLQDAAQRAYEDARLRSFSARGELSSDLERIQPLQDFEYSPAALKYMQDVEDYLGSQQTGYNLTPMNVGTNIDPQTGALLPLTNAALEGFAATPVADQFYANFNYSDPEGKGWDVGNLQFAPNQQYRLIDRKTGDVVYTGSGYEAGKNISELAKGMFDKSGQQANWVIQQAAPGSDQWTQRYEHVPDVNGFNVWLKMVAPMLGGALAAPLGLAGNLGAAAGSAIGSAGAGIASGDSIGDILKNAALSGATSYAAGQLFNKLGGRAPTGGTSSPGVTVDDFVSMGVSPGTASNIVGGLGGALPTDIVVPGARNAGALAGLGGSLANASTFTPNAPRQWSDYGDRVEQPQQEPQQAADEIVVTGTGTGPGAISGLGAAIANAAATSNAAPATQAEPQKQSTISKIADYMQLAGPVVGALGSLFGGGQSQGNRTIGGGMGGLNPTFSAKLPGANIPGLPGGTGSGAPRTAAALGQQGLRSPQDYYRYGYGPEQSFFDYVPQGALNTSQAYTGYAEGGHAVEGPGDGREDKIPAMLSDGEYVIDAETVALLGNGSNKAGADMLDQFRVKVRKHKGRELARGKFSKDAKRPEQYLAGGRA